MSSDPKLENGMESVDQETLMRYLDGELPPHERRRVEEALNASTELQRDLALFRELKQELAGVIPDALGGRAVSVWEAVNRRLARPLGWVLLVLGVLGWTAYGVYIYITSPTDPVEKLATGSVAIGILILLAGVIAERYREWLTDPYRTVQR